MSSRMLPGLAAGTSRMRWVSPPSWRRLHVEVALLGLLILFLLAAPGCQSDAAIAFRGARHYSAGNHALERGDAALAIEELRQAAALLPAASEVQNHLGLAHLARGDEGLAREAFERAIELDCDNQAARINLARTESRIKLSGRGSDKTQAASADRGSERSPESERSGFDGR